MLDPASASRHKPRMAQDADGITELSFEDALRRLEAIVQRLEGGDASLDESIKLYAEGDRLRAQCEARLTDAKARIDRITLGPDGQPAALRSFDAE